MTLTRSAELLLDRTWAYGADVQHGGRLLELVAAAALQEATHPHPLATSAHFLSAPRLGSARVDVELLRAGRSVSTYRASLLQDGRTCLETVVTAGRLGAPGVPQWLGGAPPRLPPLEECVTSRMPDGQARNGIIEQLEVRVPPPVGRRVGTVPEVSAWVRYADGREPDPLALLCLADALPPVTFALGNHGWVPTVALTVHVRALPAPGWLRLVQRAQLMQDRWLDEACEIWDSQDRLVAQAVQLAGYRPA